MYSHTDTRETQGRVTQRGGLEFGLKHHPQLTQRKKGVEAGEASYGKVTRRSMVNKGRFCYARSVGALCLDESRIL